MKSEIDELKNKISELQDQLDQKLADEKNKLAESKFSMEEKFKESLRSATQMINKHLSDAQEHFNMAVDLADKLGMPFRTGMVCGFKTDSYVPHSFIENESNFPGADIRYIAGQVVGFYPTNSGWASDHWSSSSMDC